MPALPERTPHLHVEAIPACILCHGFLANPEFCGGQQGYQMDVCATQKAPHLSTVALRVPHSELNLCHASMIDPGRQDCHANTRSTQRKEETKKGPTSMWLPSRSL